MTDDTVIENTFGKRIKNFVYNPKDEIGKGFSSVVYRGVNELTRDQIAVKVIQLGKIKNEVQKYLLNNEMKALRKLSHPNILKCIDILMTKNNVYIVTQFCKKGDLLAIVKKQGRLSETQALKYARDIVEGYSFVQDNGILHRDIKTANIFVSNDDVAKIADFGFSEFVGEAKPSIPYNVGSPAYMSPQSYQESNYSSQSDLWSIGIILFQMLVGQVPFKKHQYGQLVRNLTSGNLGIPVNVSVTQNTKRILVGCFRERLSQRLTIRKLLQMLVIQVNTQSIQPQVQVQKQRADSSMEHRRSIVGKTTRNSTTFIQIARSSQVGDYSGQEGNPFLFATSSYLNQLFRLGRLLSENKMVIAKSLVTNVICIANRNRIQLVNEADPIALGWEGDSKRDYQLIKSRMLQLPQFSDKSNPIDPNLRLIQNTPFKSEPNLNGCINYLKFSIRQFDKLIDTQPKHFQNLLCIVDYLISYMELLQLQLSVSSITEVVNSGKLLVNIKDRPVPVTPAHLKLIRYKRRMLNI